MTMDANDPRWTAYALGEIKDEQERAELESILKESPELRQLVEEARNTGELLRQELRAEPAIDLTRAQRILIEDKVASRKRWFGLRPAWVMGAAAAVVLVSILAVRELNQVQPAPQKTRVADAIPKEPLPGSIRTSELKQPAIRGYENQGGYRNQKAVQGARPDSSTHPAVEGDSKPETPAQAAPEQPEAPSAPRPVAQSAALEGTVTDASGAVLPGASIILVDNTSGVKKQTATDLSGHYQFPNLTPGRYKLTAQMPGFTTDTKTDVALLGAASSAKLNFGMQVAGVAAQMEVQSSAQDTILESSPSTGTVLKGKTMTALPTMNNDGMDHINVMGGVVRNEGDPVLSNNAQALAGVPGSSINMTRDGITVNDPRYGRRFMPPPLPIQRLHRPFNTETYDPILDNPFLDVVQNPLSAFSIDVDTASYANVRRFLDGGSLPPKDAVRIEELVNYFDYDYKGPKDEKPFAANFELAEAPWNPEHRLLRIGLKGREIKPGKRPQSNLVFLLDISGSMQEPNKLPLVKQSMRMLLDQLTEADRVAIVVYASDTEVWLPSTSGDQKDRIRFAIDRLQAGGMTNGGAGIQLAYRTAQENFIRGGTNRIILATDGDFNVGITNRGDLTRLIEEKAKSGIDLSALGFGMGNLKDATLELLAKSGHGNYAYIDTLNEAQKVLVEQINATLVPIAKDVKIQVEFNPRHVSAYRLIGYEDRVMAKEDFNDDTKDAGVIGAGHTVTALYELVPAGAPMPKRAVDPLKYQKVEKPLPSSSAADSNEVATVKIRSKEPERDLSVLSEFTVKESEEKFSNASADFKFAAAVAAFGMVLRDSPYKGDANLFRALEWASEGEWPDRHGYRQEFIRLIQRAVALSF